MAISQSSRIGSTQTTATKTKDNTKLSSDDFLKLFLTQLKNQDPTKPMDSAQMLEQTSQLTQMETQIAQQKSFDEITKTLKQSSTYQSQFALVSSIGKIAVTKDNLVSISNDSPNTNFNLYFKEPILGGDIKIYDSTGNVVRTISLTNYKNQRGETNKDENGYDFKNSSGGFKFYWDGKDDNANEVEAGSYTIKANLTAKNGDRYDSELGTYPIQSVKFKNGQAYLKIGDKFISFNDIKEIKQ